MASIFSTFPVLRTAAPRISREFFTCRSCIRKGFASTSAPLRNVRTPPLRSSPFSPSFRLHSTISSQAPVGALSQSIGAEAKRKYFPETSDKAVAYWLIGSAASVFGIVILGGLTRLTESGLSITEWRPVTGSLPPMNVEDWESEFEKYRSSPEFKLLNPNMTLPEFKKIYWMEWSHRLWGRVIGITFLLPTAYFIARRKVSARTAGKLVAICGLIGFQGFIGWWMVKSGLKDDLFAPGSHPRVSQYRLATHLGAAFIVYTFMLHSGISILRTRALLRDPVAALQKLTLASSPALRPLRIATAALFALVFTTAMSGALVAGLDAGLIYNEFPYMGVGLTPPRKELWDPWYSRDEQHRDLWWRNMLENPSLVQLDHRILATTSFSAIMGLFAWARYGRLRALLPPNVRKGITGVVHLAWMQVALGISTLIYLVPTWLAATHQAGALALLTGTLVLGSRVWVPRRALELVRRAVKNGGVVSPAPRGGAVRGWTAHAMKRS